MSKKKGDLYEKLAWEYLKGELSFTLVKRNWHAGRIGELDLICLSPKGELVFVEVKGRPGYYGKLDALASVNFAKARRLWQSAESFLQAYPVYEIHPVRFDLVILHSPHYEIFHVENICLQDLL